VGTVNGLEDIFLRGPAALMLVGALGYLVLLGKVEILLAIHLVLNQWTRTVFFWGVPHVYVLVSAVIGSCCVAVFLGSRPRHQLVSNRWIVPWSLAWALWFGLVWWAFGNEGYEGRLALINVALVVPVLWVSVRRGGQIRQFAVTYVGASLIGGVLAVNTALAGRPPGVLLSDPFLGAPGVFRNLSYNYHFFAAPFMVSLVFAWALARDAQKGAIRWCWAAAGAACAYILILTNSLQHLVGAFAALVFMASRVKTSGGALSRKLQGWIWGGTVALLVFASLEVAPDVVFRKVSGEDTLAAVASFDVRTQIWADSWKAFLSSPVFGVGLDFDAHNLFLGTLVNQGVVGLVFLIGWIWFVIRLIRHTKIFGWNEESRLWQESLLLIGCLALIVGQISGDVSGLWYLFWAPTMAWCLQGPSQGVSVHRPREAIDRTVGSEPGLGSETQ
jgi:hypothetical protein